MASFFWNVRGFNKDNKHSVMKKWVEERVLQIGGVLETRVKEGKSMRIFSKVFQDWSMINNYEYNNLGRIWLVWKPGVRVTPFFKSGQIITVSVMLGKEKEEFFYSVIYASNSEEERRELWNDLKTHHDSPIIRSHPWMVVGDFNETMAVEEHSMSDVMSQGMMEFQSAVQYCGLMDAVSHGLLFTWTNKREHGLISKKLDRVLVNDRWIGKFPNSYSVFESGGCSDHLRCRSHLRPIQSQPQRPFKFVNVLTELEGFKPRVEQFWRNTEPIFISTSAMFRFSKKMKALKPVIRTLGKERLGNLSRRTRDAFEDLCTKQEENMDNPTEQNMVEEREAATKWENLSNIEEKFLKQKSKLHWLKVGDKNNKVYHRAATVRAIRNSIQEIICKDGTVADTAETLKVEAERFFRDFLEIFCSMNLRILRELRWRILRIYYLIVALKKEVFS